MLGVILFRLSENSFLMDEISENILNEELNKLFLVKVQIREDYTLLSTTWRSRIWNEEIQNTHHSSHSVSLNLKDDNYWKPINGQIKLNVRDYICVANWRWRTIFIKNAMQEVAEKLKNWKDAAVKRKLQKQRRLGEFPMQHDQGSRTVSLFFNDLDSPSSYDCTYVPHQALIPSSSKEPSRESRMQRNTREDNPKSVFDCQPARLIPEEFFNDSRSLAASSGIQRREELRKVGVRNHGNQYLYLAFQWEQGEKVLTTNKSYAHDQPCRGYWDSYSKHDNSELSHLGDASAKNPWPNGISKLDREFPSWSLRESEESRARIAVDQEIEATSSLKDLINPKSITGKDFSDYYEELDLVMVAELK